MMVAILVGVVVSGFVYVWYGRVVVGRQIILARGRMGMGPPTWDSRLPPDYKWLYRGALQLAPEDRELYWEKVALREERTRL